MTRETKGLSSIKRFWLERIVDVSGVSGKGMVAEGVMFTDGMVALRWIVGAHRSCSLWENMEDLVQIHGHNGATVVRWVD